MWLLLKTFVSDKLLTLPGIFLLILIGFLGILLFSNSDVILSKFGFETTSTLKASLATANSDLKQAKIVNDDLNNTIKQLNTDKKKEIEAVSNSCKDKAKVDKIISDIKTKKDSTDKDLIKNIESKTTYSVPKNTSTKDKSKTTTDSGTITLPIDEINKLSESNIDSLNAAYNELFIVQKTT